MYSPCELNVCVSKTCTYCNPELQEVVPDDGIPPFQDFLTHDGLKSSSTLDMGTSLDDFSR